MKLIGRQIRYYDRYGYKRKWGVIIKIEGGTYQIYNNQNPKGYKYYNHKITDVHDWINNNLLTI